MLKTKVPFDPESKEASVYENELKALSLHAMLNESLGISNGDLSQFTFVLDSIKQNRIEQTVQLDARSFEYTVLANKLQVANNLIQKLQRDGSEQLSPIDPRYLHKYFVQSLKADNIDGVAHLVNYSHRYGVNLGNLPINNFRAALDNYLNVRFDMSKVMTFLKFYEKHFADRFRQEFSKLAPVGRDISDE